MHDVFIFPSTVIIHLVAVGEMVAHTNSTGRRLTFFDLMIFMNHLGDFNNNNNNNSTASSAKKVIYSGAHECLEKRRESHSNRLKRRSR